jgi:hypothetical protein
MAPVSMALKTENVNFEDVIRELRQEIVEMKQILSITLAKNIELGARVEAIEDEAKARVNAIEDEANARVNAVEKSETEANHKLQCVMYVREILAERQMYYHQTGSCRQYKRVKY